MTTPLVSILTVTENRAAFMPFLEWTVKRQTHPNTEHIIVAAETDTDLPKSARVIRVPPSFKMGRKRQTALDAAQGKYIVWFDDDDWQNPTRIERTVHELETTNVGFTGWGKAVFWDLRNGVWYWYIHERPIHSLATLRTELAQKTQYNLEQMQAQDSEWMTRAMRSMGSFTTISANKLPEPPSIWFTHNVNISRRRTYNNRPFGASLRALFPEGVWGDTTEQVRELRKRLNLTQSFEE